MMKKTWTKITAISALAVLLVGCFNPFDESSLGGGDAGMGSVTISLSSTLSASSSGAMVPTVAAQIATYEIAFTTDETLETIDGPVVSDITDTSQPITVDVPPGTWVVYANGYRTTGELAARAPEQTVTVTENASHELPQPLIVSPRQINGTTGAALLDVTVPPGTISEVVNVTLVPRDGQTVPTPIPGFDLISSTTLSWSMTGLPVGSYYLSAELRGPDGRGNIQTRRDLNLTLEVFTNLASRYVSAVDGSDGLIIGENQISSPPGALTDLTVAVSPSYFSDPSDPPKAQVDLSWTTSSVTASGFRVYVDGVDTTPLDFIDFGGASNVPVPAAQEVTIEVVAYNGFGESAPVSWTGTVPAQPEVVSPLNGVYVAPGTVTLEWTAAAGADSYVIGVGGSELAPDQEFTVPATPTSFNFTDGFPGLNYSWYVFAVNSSVSGRVVNSNTGEGFFRIRDGVYVNSDVPASGDGGSPTTAFGTLGEALAIAVPGETITMTAGTYTEAVSVNTPDLTIQGEGDGTLLKSPGDESATLTVNTGGSGLVLQNLQIQPSEASTRAAISVFGQNVTITGNLISDSQPTVDGATLRGISGGAPGLVVANNRFELAQSTDNVSTRFALNLTGDGLDAANPIVIESNTFTFGDAPGSSLVGIQPQAKFYRVANNVVVHNGTVAGPAFTGLRVATTETGSVAFLHNTVVNENPNRTFTGLALDAGTDTVATNNIFQGAGQIVQTGISPSGGIASEVNANLFWNLSSVAGTSGWGDTVTELNGQTFAAGNVSVDPWLDSANNYTPFVANAPIELRAGGDPSYLGVVSTDYTDFERAAPVSIGAYEVDQTGDVAQFALQGEWLLANAALTDSSGNANDGFPNESVATGGGPQPTADRANVANEAGALAADTGFELTTSSLPLGDFSGGKTFSYWITEPTANGRVISQRNPASPSTWEQDWVTDQLRFSYTGTTTGWTALAISTGTPGWVVAGWNHIALVVDAVGGTATTYLNGSPVGTADIGTNDFATDNPIRVGATALAGATFSFDDLRVYNRALNPSEIAALAAE